MRIMRSTRPVLALFAGLMLAQTAPAMAQDGFGMWRLFGSIGLLPSVDRDPIEYRDRPSLVVPKDRKGLRNPEDPEAHAQNPAWPVDPDVQDRKAEVARRGEPGRQLLRNNDPVEGNRLSVDQMRAGRAQQGAVMAEPNFTRNDQAGVRLSPDQWSAQQRQATGPSYPPGTEPPRQYLTDPPRGLRQPAAGAPMARTRENPDSAFDNGRPNDAWRRLD